MDFVDYMRRCRRRVYEICSSSVFRNRKFLLFLVIVIPIVFYTWSKARQMMGPTQGMWNDHPAKYLLELSLENRLTALRQSADDFSAHIQHQPRLSEENGYENFIGNGFFGTFITVNSESYIYIRNDRVLNLDVPYRPLVKVEFEHTLKSATALDYVNGIGYLITCYMNDICITSEYYAHRTLPNILVQDIEVINPASYNAKVYLSRHTYHENAWLHVSSLKLLKSDVGSRNESEDFHTFIGTAANVRGEEFYVSIISMKIPTHFYVKPRSKSSWQILAAVCESDRDLPTIVDKVQLKNDLLDECTKRLKTALKRHPVKLREDHVNAWQQSWNTGISISHSKASQALNGDQINATMYYVLSNVRSPFHEETGNEPHTHSLAMLSAPGCYGNIHHTLQATNLWQGLTSFNEVMKTVHSWLLTLGKQGCDNLITLGALGVTQAMVLSFGSFRFSKQHLEFNMHPKFLHRDYTFRRIQYGNGTQINVTVQLQEDNKAILLVALDKFDRPFFACDGGCLDGPVQLGQQKIQFPVKLTEPVTAILYISPDRDHLEDLRLAIHVHEVGEAPAHEHGIIALHKHGHHLGGLPGFFWVSVCILIVIFHLFLFKLIYNEYCGSYQEKKNFQDKQKVRYSKL